MPLLSTTSLHQPSLALDKCKAAIEVCQKRREKLAAELTELDEVLNELSEKKGELIQVCNESSGTETPPRKETAQSSGFDKPTLSDTDRLNVNQVPVIKSSKPALKPAVAESEDAPEKAAKKRRV